MLEVNVVTKNFNEEETVNLKLEVSSEVVAPETFQNNKIAEFANLAATGSEKYTKLGKIKTDAATLSETYNPELLTTMFASMLEEDPQLYYDVIQMAMYATDSVMTRLVAKYAADLNSAISYGENEETPSAGGLNITEPITEIITKYPDGREEVEHLDTPITEINFGEAKEASEETVEEEVEEPAPKKTASRKTTKKD